MSSLPTGNDTLKNDARDWKEYINSALNNLASVWEDDRNDPTLNYYPSIPSYSDYNILMLQIRKKRILGLLLLMNIINISNLIFPDIHEIS